MENIVPLKKLFRNGLLFVIRIFVFVTLSTNFAHAQCGYAVGLGCPGTDYNNFGYNSKNSPATIEYDNYVSGYHQTVARTFTGEFQIWGHFSGNDGTTASSVLTPQAINATNYPALTGTVLKATIGSWGFSNQQTIVLTSTGLFALAGPGIVLSTDITNTRTFSKLTINGRSNGLPIGVEPSEVKMLFATYLNLVITTCSGDVWVITATSAMRGNNSSGNKNGWYRVITDEPGNPRLTGIMATRGGATALMALRNDGTVWTWGTHTYLGDGSAGAKRIVASKMTLPKAGTVKMIGATSDGTKSSYYVLYTDGSLYSLGDNAKRQLGDWTTTERTTWVQPRYNSASGPVMNDIRWISPMEHDRKYPAVDVINTGMHLYNWGHEEGHALGRGNMPATAVDPGMPLGLTMSDEILSVEAGGHTTMFTERCHQNFGYVGHRIYGSMGNGSVVNTYESVINYNTAYVPICGAMNTPVIGAWVINTTGDVCDGATILLDPSPEGGALTVVSGPGVLNGNELTFTATGTVELQYIVSSDCGLKTITRTFDVNSCSLYKIRGMVWIDKDEDAIRDAGEVGTNAGTRLTDGLWANLVDINGKVLQSVPVNMDGTYTLNTVQSGSYSVHITNEQIGIGVAIQNPSRTLPGDWEYTGHNDGIPCVVPACTDPDIIGNVSVGPTNPEVSDLDFGIIGPLILPVRLISFDAFKNGKVAQLKWATADEQNNLGFEIQRSADGINWRDLGFVETAVIKGVQHSALNYGFTDDSPLNGVNYYRLRLIGTENRFTYSRTTVVQFDFAGTRLMVYPNPTKDIANIKGLKGNETVHLFDFSGRRLNVFKAHSSTEKVDLSSLAPGTYHIVVTNERGESSAFRIIRRDR